MNNDATLIIKYINAWAWHMIAVIFLGYAIISSMLGKYIFTLSCAIIMGIAEYIAVNRQQDFYKEQNGNT